MTANPWIRPDRPIVIAHRGQSLEVPENTLEAYRRAIDLGTHMIEADVNITRDGKLVMIHDWTVDRTTDGTGRVNDLTLANVRALDAGSWFAPEFAGLRVPTTEETIDLARDAGIMMCFEAKGGYAHQAAAIAEALADLLVERDALGWAFMSGYDHDALASAKRRAPALMLAPERLPDYTPVDPAEALRQARTLDAPVIQNHYRLLTTELVSALHEADVALWTWPTTEPQSVVDSLAFGLDAVMGPDVPAMLQAVNQLAPNPA